MKIAYDFTQDILMLSPFYLMLLLREIKVIGINRFNMSLRFVLGMFPTLFFFYLYLSDGVPVNPLLFFALMIPLNMVPIIAGIAMSLWIGDYTRDIWLALSVLAVYALSTYLTWQPRRY